MPKSNVPSCPHCQAPMHFVRHIVVKEMPDLYVFYCAPCQHAETVKQEQAESITPARAA